MKHYKAVLFGLVVVLLFVLPLQSSVLNSVRGKITDKATGDPIPGVKITLTIGAAEYSTTTDAKGGFYKSGLKNGVYKVKYEKEGYIPAMTSVRLSISEKRDISVKLEVMAVVAKPKEKSLLRKGVEKLNAQNYPEAIEILTKAIENTPENPLLYYYRGFSLDKTGEPDKALADYKKSLELKPDFQLSLPEAGKILAKKGDVADAVTYYKKAYDLGTTDVLALYNYGSCLINLGNNDDAMKVFEKLLTVDPNYPDAHYQMGIIYLGLGDNAKSKAALKKFLELDPENSNASVATEILKTMN